MQINEKTKRSRVRPPARVPLKMKRKTVMAFTRSLYGSLSPSLGSPRTLSCPSCGTLDLLNLIQTHYNGLTLRMTQDEPNYLQKISHNQGRPNVFWSSSFCSCVDQVGVATAAAADVAVVADSSDSANAADAADAAVALINA